MKPYYDQLSELRIAETRLKSLQDKKKMLEERITGTTSRLKEVAIFGNGNNDKMTDYVMRCEELNKQIEEVKEEVRILKNGLCEMDDIIKNISGMEERIFRLKYIENKTVTQISYIIPCGEATVYRYLSKIKEAVKIDKKW